MKFLSYSGDEADRRIKAMHVLRDVPSIEGKIGSGVLGVPKSLMELQVGSR